MRWLFLVLFSLAAFAQKKDAPHARLSASLLYNEGGTYLVLSLEHDEGWHTYWKNPGDAGIPSEFKFFQNKKEVKLAPKEWPAPHRYLEAGDILAYGYSGVQHFFFDPPQNIQQGLFEIEAHWLVCKDICIPGEQKIEITKGKFEQKFQKEAGTASLEIPAKTDWPKNLSVYLSKRVDGGLVLNYSLKDVFASELDHHYNLLTPFPAPPFAYKKETLAYEAPTNTIYGEILVEWDGDLQEPPRDLPANGIFKPAMKANFLFQIPGQHHFVVIEKDFTDFALTSKGLTDFFKTLTPLDPKAPYINAASPAAKKKNELSFLILALAFVGGLILNLMPCVLPVISIKLFGLIKYQNLPRQKILKHNIAYTMGVIGTFWLLAFIVLAFKKTGENIGWGFQLQSPVFVLGMILILFVLALNMFGLFEFATPGGSKLGGAKLNESFAGDFLAGVLSTILSTPCSAPFLGTALTFAFSSGPKTIFLIFTFIGLGLSSPFLLTALIPQGLHLLPKPGAWMEKLKYFLGLTLILTVLWLTDVFFTLVDVSLWLLPLMSVLAFLFFAFFARKKITKNIIWQVSLFAVAFMTLGLALKNIPLTPPAKMPITTESATWGHWSHEEMTKLKDQWVFMDFTAAWCLTCKVNKKLVLDTDAFKKFTALNKIKLLEADWTKRDEVIAKFLETHGAVSVPAYFLQKPSGEVVFLGETISISKIEAVIAK